MKIKTHILILINSLVVLVVIVLSLISYNQFSKVLDERILLQLNSIKTLKKKQIENLIHAEWNDFKNDSFNYSGSNVSNIKFPEDLSQYHGVYDFSKYHENKEVSIVFISNNSDSVRIKVLDYAKIKSVLLERTGMGYSGESYLVAEDFRMRSQSRFFPAKNPFFIEVQSIGVKNGLKGVEGKGVFKDYRGVEVYSVYSPLNISYLRLVILSEIDKTEVTKPLKILRQRLMWFTLIILFIAIILSLFLTRIIANPIKNMRQSLKVMAEGDYSSDNEFKKRSAEINDMFNALIDLKTSLRGAVAFSEEIGKMNLATNYKPKGKNDVLGHSLLTMRDRLVAFREREKYSRTETRKLLVDGLEKERRRLSRELHDGVGPYLTSLKHYVENKIDNESTKNEMKMILDQTISEIRLMSYALMPSSLYDFGIGPTLTNYVENLKRSTDINMEFEDLTKSQKSKVTKQQSINLFRIGQELINNGLKHAGAKTIKMTLSEFDEFISLFYFDDGVGFKFHEIELGSGILNIKERVEICNGTIEINSDQYNTTFEIELPIE